MNSYIEPFRSWFGYTRRERRASFMLLIIIVLIISVRYLFPEKNISIENVPVYFSENLTCTVPKASPGDEPLLKRSEGNRSVRIGGRQSIRQDKRLVVDINRCDTSELKKLSGIGPVLSLRIVKYRYLLGGYASSDQLMEVYGLPAETFDRIRDQIYVDTLMIKTIDVNSADYKTLIRFPYFEKHEVISIMKYREHANRINALSELVENKIITDEKALKVRSYLRFE